MSSHSDSTKLHQIPLNPVRFEQAGNPYYPLPSDYETLDPEGQRQARVNAISLKETGEDVVNAWQLMRKFYLDPLPPGAWYKPPYHPSPPLHYSFIHDMAVYPRNVQVFPRAFAKSTLIREFILLCMISRPYFNILMVKAKQDYIKSDFQKFKRMLEDNPYIRGDFGKLAPKRGEGIWSNEHLVLANGVECVGIPVLSTMLGPRPNIWIMDDVEVDPKMRISPTLLTENMQNLLREQLIPTLDEGCTGHVVGTLASRRMHIYRMATVTIEDDPGMAFWNRAIYPAAIEGQLTWSQKFSYERLQRLREELGDAAFLASYMNDPGTEQDRLLLIDEKLGQYSLLESDDAQPDSPLRSPNTLVSWIRGKADKDGNPTIETIKRPYGETVSGMYRAMLVDPILRPGTNSDYAAIMVVGRENSSLYRDTLFVLDLKLEKLSKSELIQEVWRMGLKWLPRIVGVEAVGGLQHDIVETMSTEFAEKSIQAGWMPRVYPLQYKGHASRDKGSRIASALLWRFEQNRVKFPRHLRYVEPFSTLYYQVENFTEDLRLLPYDDAIDALAMWHYLLKPRGRYLDRGEDVTETPMQLLERGEIYFPGTRIAIVSTMNASDLSPKAIQALQDRRYRHDRRKQKGRRGSRYRPHRVVHATARRYA